MRNRVRRTAAVLSAALLLASCDSGGADEPDDEPSEPSESATSEAPEEEAQDLYRGTVFEPLPDGEPQLLATIREKRTFPSVTDFLGFGGVVFGDEVALLAPETQLHTAVSVDTGKVLWQTRLPRYQGEVEPMCPLAQLPPDATVAVVMVGLDCGLFLRYDLDTGRLLGKDPQLDSFGMPHINASFSLGRYTYWVDDQNNIRRFGADGDSEFVLPADDLGLKPSENVFSAMPIVGTDVVSLSITDYRGPIDAVNDGRWLGLQVPEEGTPEVVWSQHKKAAVVEARPRGRYSPEDLARTNPEYGGIVYSIIRKGIRTPRLNRFNPQTGALDTGLILQRDPPGGFPAWADSLGRAYLLPMTDAMYSASGNGGFGGFAHVTKYDLTTGDVAWSFTKEYPHLSPQASDPIGMSSDGSRVYAMVWADEARLVELDAETGDLLRTWRFPENVGWELTSAEVYIHGDLMVWLSRFDSSDKMFAATFRLG